MEIQKNYLREIANFAIELSPFARVVISLWVTGMERKTVRGVQYSPPPSPPPPPPLPPPPPPPPERGLQLKRLGSPPRKHPAGGSRDGSAAFNSTGDFTRLLVFTSKWDCGGGSENSLVSGLVKKTLDSTVFFFWVFIFQNI